MEYCTSVTLYLVGYTYRNTLTMHGTMNVKCKMLIRRTSNDGTTALFTEHQYAYTHSNQYCPSTRKVTRVKNSHLQFWYSSAQNMQRFKIIQVCTSVNVPKTAVIQVIVKPHFPSKFPPSIPVQCLDLC
jgi:hypothetical protein